MSLNTIKETTLDVLKIPKEFNSAIQEFSTHTLILVKGDKLDGVTYALPGQKRLYSRDGMFSAYGLRAPGRDILVVQDPTIEGEISKDDLLYYSDLNVFTIKDNLKCVQLTPDELFIPLQNLVSSEPVGSMGDSILRYKSAIHGCDIYVRKGSNRHKFISGKSDFFDDPMDFYVTKDKMLSPDSLSNSASNRDMVEAELIVSRIEQSPVKACLGLLSEEKVRNVAAKAIELRRTYGGVLTQNTYWECDYTYKGAPTFASIEWDKVEEAMSEMKDNEDSYQAVSMLVHVINDNDSWAPFSLEVFWVFFLLLDTETIDYLDEVFNLTKGGEADA